MTTTYQWVYWKKQKNRFKEGVVVQDIITGMGKLASDIDAVNNKDDYAAYVSHSSHDEFAATFKSVIEHFVPLDFPTVLVKWSKTDIGFSI
ncbi:Stress-response A/B barrel domain-containing protein [Drosera capensis]